MTFEEFVNIAMNSPEGEFGYCIECENYNETVEATRHLFDAGASLYPTEWAKMIYDGDPSEDDGYYNISLEIIKENNQKICLIGYYLDVTSFKLIKYTDILRDSFNDEPIQGGEYILESVNKFLSGII